MGRKRMTPAEPPTEGTAAPTAETPKYNRSARIRELWNNGVKDAKQILASLKADGDETNIGIIYTSISKIKKDEGGGAPAPKKRTAPVAPAQSAVHIGNGISLLDLEALGVIVKNVGGFDNAIRVLQALKELR